MRLLDYILMFAIATIMSIVGITAYDKYVAPIIRYDDVCVLGMATTGPQVEPFNFVVCGEIYEIEDGPSAAQGAVLGEVHNMDGRRLRGTWQ